MPDWSSPELSVQLIFVSITVKTCIGHQECNAYRSIRVAIRIDLESCNSHRSLHIPSYRSLKWYFISIKYPSFRIDQHTEIRIDRIIDLQFQNSYRSRHIDTNAIGYPSTRMPPVVHRYEESIINRNETFPLFDTKLRLAQIDAIPPFVTDRYESSSSYLSLLLLPQAVNTPLLLFDLIPTKSRHQQWRNRQRLWISQH